MVIKGGMFYHSLVVCQVNGAADDVSPLWGQVNGAMDNRSPFSCQVNGAMDYVSPLLGHDGSDALLLNVTKRG